MKAPRTQLASIISKRTLKSGLSKADAQAIAAYLLDEGRTNELDSLVRDVQAAWAKNGHVEVIARSAHELNTQVLQDVETEARRVYPDATRIVITPKLDPDVVGGVRLTIVDRQLDLTVERKLKQFKMLAVHGKDR